MNSVSLKVTLFSLLLASCGDPPLYNTKLPNNYSYTSNGGSYGVFRHPNGTWFSTTFGITSENNERWCAQFAWEEHLAICKEQDSVKYVVLNTSTGNIIFIENEETAKEFWKTNLGTKLPEMKIKYANTSSK